MGMRLGQRSRSLDAVVMPSMSGRLMSIRMMSGSTRERVANARLTVFCCGHLAPEALQELTGHLPCRRMTSTTSTLRPGPGQGDALNTEAWPEDAQATGRERRSVNSLPRPRTDCSSIRPPMILASRREMARPRPVPPKRRVTEASVCVKGSKMRSCSSSGMPIPVLLPRRRRAVSDCPRSPVLPQPLRARFRSP